VKIQGTIGGNRIGFIGDRLRNGDLGPSRLIPNASLYRPETDVDEAGADYLLGKAREREQAERDKIADPMYDAENKPLPWPDEDVGELMRMYIAGKTLEVISQEMGRTHAAVKQKVYALRKALLPKSKAEAASMSARNTGKKHGP
jgi:hypothetical protein